MPIYEYLCESCGHFDFRQDFEDEPLKTCPTCSKEVRRIISPNTVIWKGRFKWMKFNPEVKEEDIDNP